MTALPLSSGSATSAGPAVAFLPTRAAGLERLDAFLPRAGRAYAAARNYDFGPDNRGNVSSLSPYVRHRLVTEGEIVSRVLTRHTPATAEKFIQEVCWRTYWKGWLEHRPALWPAYLAARDEALQALERDRSRASDLAAAIEGRTGIACFDAWARELVTTGYLHNHTRMWFASIWIFTLRLPWVLGADHFYRHLLDGDPASNTLSWRWVAGLHTRGKTYLARPANIVAYTDGRFPETRGLSPCAPPLEDDLPDIPRSPLKQCSAPPGAPALLLLHEEDLSPETLALEDARVAAIAMLAPVETSADRAPAVLAFKNAALDDAGARARAHFAAPLHEVAFQDASCLAKAIAGIARDAQADAILTPEAAIGPTRTLLDAAAPALAAAGTPLHRLRRDWDAALWPHATGGFFKLKKHIPAALAECGITR